MLNDLRQYKFLGVATFDLVSGFTTFAALGYGLSGRNIQYAITTGLLSVPVGVIAHIIGGIETPLTEFVTSGNPHLLHAVAIGGLAGLVSRYSCACLSTHTAINLSMSMTILATLYMKEYGHSLPTSWKKAYRKLMFRTFMKYKQIMNK